VCGFKGVGKTTWVEKLVSNKFEYFNIVSIGVEEYIKSVDHPEGGLVKLKFIVLPGDGLYKRDYTGIYRQADYFLLFYDVSARESYDYAVELVNYEIGKYIKTNEEKGNKNIMVIGNKSDLARGTSLDRLDILYRMNAFRHLESSARTSSNQPRVISAILGYIY
jgi:small GTP-binding protein